MGQKSRQKRDRRKTEVKQPRKRDPRRAFLRLAIPNNVSVMDVLRKDAETNPAASETLKCLEETVDHFKVPAETREQALEAIERTSLLVCENKGLQIPPLSETPSDDEKAMHSLMDMVEYFHSIATPRLENLNPIRN